MDIPALKKQVRRNIKQAEQSLSREFRKISDAAVVKNIISLETYQAAKTVFLFVSYGCEINTTELIEDAFRSGKRVGVPLCTGKGIMEIKEIRSMDELQPGYCGIPEPSPEAPAISRDEVDFALIPCFSCDREGRRLGKGGGFYDRFLEGFKGSTAIIVRECLMNYNIPMEKHDARVLPVVTDHHIYR